MDTQLITAVALGIGLSASAGFRVFVPLLVASAAAHFGILPLNESFAWMGSPAALVCFGIATTVEILAYYIPLVDNLLDTIAVPLSVIAGTLLMTSVFPSDNEWMKWVAGFVVGGGAAATIQSGSVITRLMSSKLTAGTANPIVSTGEGIAATGFSILSLFSPVIVAIVLCLFILVVLRFTYRKLLRKKHP
ncbi:MAG: DUF4126 domain-containing protein [Dysgonamonadaceae bacterium]|jgi:hypothetical protein|nr:DUF4126 domain-containing protein [Dysgonamonadaceae bacterium]